MKKENSYSVLMSLFLIITLIIPYYLLYSLNASFKDYIILSINLLFLVGCIGNIVKDYHYKETKKKNNNKSFNNIFLN